MQLYVCAHVIVYVKKLNLVKWSSWSGEERRKIDFFVQICHQETLLYGKVLIVSTVHTVPSHVKQTGSFKVLIQFATVFRRCENISNDMLCLVARFQRECRICSVLHLVGPHSFLACVLCIRMCFDSAIHESLHSSNEMVAILSARIINFAFSFFGWKIANKIKRMEMNAFDVDVQMNPIETCRKQESIEPRTEATADFRSAVFQMILGGVMILRLK